MIVATPVRSQVRSAMEIDNPGDSSTMTETPEDGSTRWSRVDQPNLDKLAQIIAFIAGPQSLYSESVYVKTHLIQPLLQGTGPTPGSIQVLVQVMGRFMIRHRYTNSLFFCLTLSQLIMQELNMSRSTKILTYLENS